MNRVRPARRAQKYLRPPSSSDGSEGRPQEIVSVRFSDEEMRRIEAFAVIFETTPNAVIREGCNFYLSQQVGTPGYDEALAAYHRRTAELAGVLD